MSQRKAEAEKKLEQLENWLGQGARSKKLLEILEVKVEFLPNAKLQETAKEDIEELRRIVKNGQGFINWVISELGL